MLNAACRKEDVAGFIHSFPEGILDLFDASCFASFSKVFVAGFSITCPVIFLEVDVRSPWTFNRGQFGLNDDKDGQIIAGP